MIRLWSRGNLSPRNGPSYPRLLVAWLPQFRASGLRLVVLLVPDTLCQLCLLQFCPLLLLRRVVPFALEDSSVAALGAVRDLARDAAEVPLQVGACLQRHWQEWVVKTLWYDYVLPFHRDPPLSSAAVEFPSYREGLDCHLALEAVVSEMLVKGATEPVVDPQAGLFSHVFLVPKTTKGWRPICDLSVLNCFLVVTHFCMETVSSVLESMAEGKWMVSLDLQDAYYQVPIHPQSRKYSGALEYELNLFKFLFLLQNIKIHVFLWKKL
ncbi:hypothetical protein E2C01_070177 [Portunus trituberculatus]|uniref:Reverse transcriptase domain-containing protein n=1 Tax=Portunus trituberculatus TaxID=210409 RepID=A0A5B7HTH4_PORTR|nr:hypothetical protein [Portunus trituberculatus]